MAARASPPPTPGSTTGSVDGSERKNREAAADEIFQANKFDDFLPLQLTITSEVKAKRGAIYSIRVRTGPYADPAYADFTVEITSEKLQQLVLDLKTVGYSPLSQQLQIRTSHSATPSPVPSENSAAGSIESNLDVLSSSSPLTTPTWSIHRKFWQDFLQSLCTSLMASTNPSFRCLFFPNLTVTDWHRLAMQHASMVLGSEGVYELEERLPGIGWRFAKHYGIVREVDNRDSRLMMSWTFLGRKYSHCEVKERQEALKQLLRLQHPFIYPIMYETFHEAGCLIMHQICPSGSLKDRIYKAKPLKAFHRKYTRCHERRPFPLEEVRLYGRQILEALKAIHEAGLPYGSLHARNVMLENGVCRLTDIHNTVIGLPGYYRPYLIQLPKICMFPSIDVYCFGRILYEMTFGEGLDAPCIDSIPPECPVEIQPVLNLLITTNACFEKGMPTVKFLLSIPLFHGVDLGMEVPVLKLSSKVVGTSRGLAERYEKRLSDAEKAFNRSTLSDGVFFRPISPVLSRVRKSGSMQAIKGFFMPSSQRNSRLGQCFPSRKPTNGRCTDESNAEDSTSEAEESMVHNGRRSKSYDRNPTIAETPI
ncbi:PX domain-containing protein kinase-like protein [Hypsibius exemplaris]|uniref:PX domain-containing protein kinase-like protein n=1 Tax=Hypsibius exemplaris TaxID=2072580 RepID=A0A1W0WA53_HYPEX|nr:PX domain-containing protein kinase-like protein [Hypsibius exemplaris]